MRRSRLYLATAALAAFFVVAVVAGGAADTFQVRLVSQTSSTITLGWDPQPGYGYLFFADGTLVSRTNDPATTKVKFSKSYSVYGVSVIVEGATGTYPPPAPPPPPVDTQAPTVTMTSPANGGTVNGVVTVSASASDNVGVARVDFFRDGNPIGSDTTPPYSVLFDTSALADGTHTFGGRAVDAAGNTGFAGQVSVTVTNQTPPPPSNATVFVSTTGNDANACTQAAPCLSFNRAYQVAPLGATVQVAGGAYGAQTITDASNKDTTGDQPDVVIQPAAGAMVTVVDLTLGGNIEGSDGPDHLTIKGISDNSTSSGDCDWASFGGDINDVTFDNVHTCNFTINHEAGGGQVSDGLTIKNSDIGPCQAGGPTSCGNIKIDGADGFVFKNNYVHDFTVSDLSSHFECMFISDTDNAVIEGNRFSHCWLYNIFFQQCNPANGGRCVLTNVTLQNNWFERTWSGSGNQDRSTAVELASVSNFLVRFNVFWNAGLSVSTPMSNFRVYGNIMGPGSCGFGMTFDYNVFTHGASQCGTNATSANATDVFVNAGSSVSGGDWHLKSGTNVAVDFVTSTGIDFLLGYDRDGDVRPVGPARDAGSDERTGG